MTSATPENPSAVRTCVSWQSSGSRIPSRSIFARIFGFSCFVFSAASSSTVLKSVTVSACTSTSQPDSGCTSEIRRRPQLQRLAGGLVGGGPGGRADDAPVAGVGNEGVHEHGRVDHLEVAGRRRPHARPVQLGTDGGGGDDVLRDELARLLGQRAALVTAVGQKPVAELLDLPLRGRVLDPGRAPAPRESSR